MIGEGEEMIDDIESSIKESPKDSISPTQPILMSQHQDILRNRVATNPSVQSPQPKSQSLEEIMGPLNRNSPNEKTNVGIIRTSPVGLKNS
jgi:hypothetical protein